jgi:hypothetical protein
MTWTKGLAAAGLAAALVAGCSDRRAENQGERAAQATERAGERTQGTVERAGEKTENAMERAGEKTGEAMDRAGEKTAAAGQEAAAGVSEAGKEIAGTVKRITDDTLEVGDRELRIGENTEFYRDGVRIERSEVRPGDEIRAAFDETGDKLEAKRIEVGGRRVGNK